VRRANKFGTGFKAEYSCCPLTHQEHDIQTRLGELACLKEFLPAEQVAAMFDGVSYEVSVLKAKHGSTSNSRSISKSGGDAEARNNELGTIAGSMTKREIALTPEFFQEYDVMIGNYWQKNGRRKGEFLHGEPDIERNNPDFVF